MVESTCFQHTSSHPDKYNNSVDGIISKEEEREDPRRDSSIYLQVQNTVVFPHFYKNYKISSNTVYFHTQSSNYKFPQLILCTELILLQEIPQLQGSSHADHYKASSSNCSPCLQAFYTAE